ncbi:MAG: GAF domain-containing protein [Nitrospirae bacterium]|nr:GAF domain-containing protein [Nitrospirota bacterium]
MARDKFTTFLSGWKSSALVIDNGYKVIGANPAYCNMKGLKEPEIIGSACYKVSHDKNEPCTDCLLEDALKTGMSSVITRSYLIQDKPSHFQIEVIPIGKKVVLETTTDITDEILLKEEFNEQAVKLQILEKVLGEWPDVKTPRDILERVCNTVLTQLGYKMVWVGLIKKDSYDVMPMFSMGFEEGYLSSIKVTYDDSPYGMGPTGMCIKTGKPQIMRDIAENPKYEPWRKEAIKRGYLSSSAFPLISKGKAIGALNIYSTMPDAFPAKDIEVIEAFAGATAIAIENSMLMETVIKGQEEWMTTFDSITNPIFIHDRQYRIIRANKAYVEMAGVSFKDAIEKPYYEIFPKRQDALPSCKDAVKEGRIEPRKIEKIEAPSGETLLSMAFPIYEADVPVSFVHIFTDITELTKAYVTIEEEAKISSSLLDLSNSVSKLLDIGAILQEVSKTIIKLVSARKTAIFLRDTDEEKYKAIVFHGWSDHLVPVISTMRLTRGEMPAVDMFLDGEDVFINNASSSEFLSNQFRDLELGNIVISPIETGEGVMGAVMVEKKEQFSQKDKSILRGIISTSSIAVENAKLYKDSIEISSDLARRVETIRTTYEIDRTILSTLNRKEILEVVAKNTQRIIPADKVITIELNDEDTGYIYRSGLIPIGASPFLYSIIKTGRVVSVPDLSVFRHPETVTTDFIKEGFSSLIAIPLYTKGKKFGCIIMASKRVAAFDKEDIANGEKLTAQVAIALENAKLYEDIKELFISIIGVLVNAVDAKSTWTKGHSERVTTYAMILGKEMGLAEGDMEKLRLASLLHDIGKIGTYDVILDKPERLTDDEFALVKMHPAKGAEILEPIKQLKDIAPIIKGHHEKLDGSGYPDGLKGDEIPLLARILCVSDSFDSMTADRPYRPAPGKEYAVSELKRCSGTQFDPRVVEAFLRGMKKFE